MNSVSDKASDKACLYAVLRTVAYIILVLLAWNFIKKFLFPFFLAFLLSVAIRPIAKRVCKGTRLSKKVVSVILLSLAYGAVALMLVYAVGRLYDESVEITSSLVANAKNITESVVGFIEKIKELVHLDEGKNSEYIYSLIEKSIDKAFGELSSSVATSAASVVSRLPSAFLSFFVFLFASYYITADYETVCSYLSGFVPSSKREMLSSLKRKVEGALKKVGKAYLLLFLLTFAELYLAFLLLKVQYRFTIAIVVALLDMLPAIGVGIILVPWALFELWNGNKAMAFSLLSVYIIITAIRELIEPRVMGKSLGVHPLAALVSVYAGIKMLGFAGAFVAPIALALVKAIFEKNEDGKKQDKSEQ